MIQLLYCTLKSHLAIHAPLKKKQTKTQPSKSVNKFKELLNAHQPAMCPKFKSNKLNLLLSSFSQFSRVLAWSS